MNNLFDPEFYPTPPEVIARMAAPYADRLGSATILEPSAGNGAILDFIVKKGVRQSFSTSRGHSYEADATANRERVYAIERNPELQMILQHKGYRVIASDFLTFQPEHRFDLILQNPPFGQGAEHLLHAWDILQGGDIACLLNAETVRNPFSASRKRLARIIADYGSVEFIGQPFRTADNPTDVEVALVRLHKEAENDPFRIDLDGFAAENDPDFGSLAQESDQVAVNGQLDAYLRCWELTKASAVEFIKAFARLRFYSQHLLPDKERGAGVLDQVLKKLGEVRYSRDSMAAVYNAFLDNTKASAWNAIFAQIGLGKYMTTGLQKKLDEFRTAQGAMSITKENIFLLFRFIMTNLRVIMDQSIVEVYDLFTRYFSGNTAHNEGWKTNKRFQCNRKVILPNVADAGFEPQKYGYDPFFGVSWSCRHHLDDIDKAMCWLTGTDFESLDGKAGDSRTHREPSGPRHTIANALQTIPVGDQDWHDSAFFKIKAFKKGTIHLFFKEEALWTNFNLSVNQGKNQLGMAE